MGAAREIHGAAEVAEFCRRARGATPALLDGAAAAVWLRRGRPRVVYSFTVGGERITAIDVIADPARLRRLDLVILDG
jgi:RNA polymerase sigma-70 factor (ECF subfamily)